MQGSCHAPKARKINRSRSLACSSRLCYYEREMKNKTETFNRAKLKKQLYGKTIKSIDSLAVNMWTINFSDGSSVELWAESDGPLGLSTINLENFKDE